MMSFLFLVVCAIYSTFQSGFALTKQALRAEITNLPGQPPVDFKQYSGYVNINATSGASIFYWYQECELGVNKCPLFMWTNGGPGCSGLQAGLTEQGAFRILPNGTLAINPYSWNKYVNIVYIEQPIGVGFSYSNDHNDYINGDQKSAKEMYEFLLGFYKIFPETQSLDFYMSSESYGGHYCPVFAKYIVDHDTSHQINFKGFIVGNPLTDQTSREQGHFGTLYGHQLLSYPLFTEWRTTCNNGLINNSTCNSLKSQMNKQIQRIFGEGLDFPVCINVSNWTQSIQIDDKYYYKYLNMKKRDFHYKSFGNGFQYPLNNKEDIPYNCVEDFEATYLNRNDVKTALHANMSIKWVGCGNINYNGTDVGQPMQPIYQYLINSSYDLHITIYSGDDDSNCATMSVQQWIYNMSWTIEKSWTQWLYDSENFGQQLGGYYVKFKDAVNFITVHSAGHEVPFFRPAKALIILQKYLNGDI